MAESAESELLEKIVQMARAKRSAARRLRPLRQLAMEKLVTASEKCAFQKPSCLTPFAIPLSLQKEIQKYAEEHFDLGEIDGVVQTLGMANWMFDLAGKVLLNEFTKEFNFVIFRTFHNLDQQVWEMLIDRCPNLEKISDTRCLSGLMESVLPYLKRFPKLEHICYSSYLCTSDDLIQISKHFPNLRTLSVTFEGVNIDLMTNLFALQRLERLEIQLPFSQTDNEDNYWYNHFKAECLSHLPNLQYLFGGNEYHNNHQIPGNRKLSLREMKVFSDFDYELVPYLEELAINNPSPVAPQQLFSVISKLTSLSLDGFGSLQFHEVLSQCGDRLEDLHVVRFDNRTVDPYKIIVKCPKLRRLHIGGIVSFENSPYRSQSVDHFQNMEEFTYVNFSGFHISSESELMQLVLKSKNIVSIHMFCNSLSSLSHLIQCLVEGPLLQKLKTIILSFGLMTDTPSNVLKFLCLLALHAPRLEYMRIVVNSDDLRAYVLSSSLSRVEGLKFSCLRG
ncbi:uncharacterized protein LOC132204274 [Neocloeon triangulifer]|uniref:uncharacterized protein LOC132204274 n=1 Tax=Neocloeon triangulifer TaxID=2078957 RepID=UPI00286F5435|nr:uncharacterized protein LOC132204274 [Neocloeon triangulifer]XP_059488657.1 uncharacterized protein LOC132204274 [Neocloeon triangulifer]XP_059488658.1 uncharacterized protein LOC132204274 [Neocloeon triangulifer]